LAFQELVMKWPKKEKNLTEKVEEDFAPHFVQECVSHAKSPDEKTQSVLVHLYLWEICVYSCPLGFKAPATK